MLAFTSALSTTVTRPTPPSTHTLPAPTRPSPTLNRAVTPPQSTTQHSSSSSPTMHELNRILGKCKHSLITPKTVSWSDEKHWKYHSYTPDEDTPTLPPVLEEPQPNEDTHSTTSNLLLAEPSSQHTPISTSLHYHSRKPDGTTAPLQEQNSTCALIHTSVAWPEDIIQIIKSICANNLPAPNAPEFTFELTQEAAMRNLCILHRYDYNIETALKANSNTPLSYGSEFRPIPVLQPLLFLHPYWSKFKTLLTHGSDWPLTPITKQEREADLEEALAFGNHKEAVKNSPLLKSLIADDVTQGFALPLPLDKLQRIKGVLLAPLNIASQDTINEFGQIIPKKRLTHDQSYIFHGSGTSVNSRTDKSKLTPCIFGWAIRRLAHWIVCARRKHPR